MELKSWINGILEDLSSLEVATLTTSVKPLDLNDKKLSKAQDEDLKAANVNVENARKALLDAIKSTEEKKKKRDKIRTAKDELREAKKQLDETRQALGLYDPKDLFSKIRAELPQADLVAYSRFELEGDSTNYINNNPAVESLVDKHDTMVAASQEARKAIFDTALRLLKIGK